MLAQMIHQSNLATWFARVAARTFIWLTLPPLVALYIGLAVGEPSIGGLGWPSKPHWDGSVPGQRQCPPSKRRGLGDS